MTRRTLATYVMSFIVEYHESLWETQVEQTVFAIPAFITSLADVFFISLYRDYDLDGAFS